MQLATVRILLNLLKAPGEPPIRGSGWAREGNAVVPTTTINKTVNVTDQHAAATAAPLLPHNPLSHHSPGKEEPDARIFPGPRCRQPREASQPAERALSRQSLAVLPPLIRTCPLCWTAPAHAATNKQPPLKPACKVHGGQKRHHTTSCGGGKMARLRDVVPDTGYARAADCKQLACCAHSCSCHFWLTENVVNT